MSLELQFPNWPTFGEQEEKAVEDVIRSGQLFADQKLGNLRKILASTLALSML